MHDKLCPKMASENVCIFVSGHLGLWKYVRYLYLTTKNTTCECFLSVLTVVDVILLHPGHYSATAKFSPVWALRGKTTHGTQILFYIKTRSPLDSFASHNICNSFFLSNDITGSKSWDDFLAKSAFFSHICSLLKEHQSKKAQRKNLVHVTF